MFLCLFSLLCCAFILLENTSACWPYMVPALSTTWAWRDTWKVWHGQQDVFFLSQTSTTSLSTGCTFLLVFLISPPKTLAANSDPGCSSFFLHIGKYLSEGTELHTCQSSAVTDNLCSFSCPPPLPFHSAPELWSCWMEAAWQQGFQLVLSTKHTLRWTPACTSPFLGP